MIVESHAHYTHSCFEKPFSYLKKTEEGYAICQGQREDLLQEMQQANICCAIEPGITLASCEKLLQFCAEQPQHFFPAVGVHPTRCMFEKWADRKQLDALAQSPGVIAIGETGLDYHKDRKEQKRLTQHLWFLYQLELAGRLQKPLILHIRQAHKQALRILRHHPARRLGGVVHCFQGTAAEAAQYVALGYHIGIGGALLQPQERAGALWEAVRAIPLERILVETDAPYVLPYCKDIFSGKKLRRTRNSSLILPAVIEKIAQLKALPAEVVERATAENAIRLFSLPIQLP